MSDAKKTIKILFVEDVPTDAELAQRELRKGGLEFTFVRVDTEEAFTDALTSFDPDIVVSDYSMPVFDGRRALAIVRARSAILPFVMLTGALNEDTAVACMKAGADDYVIKEHISRLPFAVREALAKRDTLELAERQRAQMEETAARYQALFDECNAVMCVVDPGTQVILDVNRAGCEFYGWPKEELIGKRAVDLGSPPEDMQMEAIARGMDNPRAPLVFKQHKADGTERYVETYNGSLVLDGNPLLLSIVHDITDRVTAERDLFLKSAALEAAANAIVILDREGKIRWLNAAFERLSGYPASEAIGQPCGELMRSKEGIAAYMDLWKTIQSGRIWRGELVNVRKSGERYIEEMTVTPVLDKSGAAEHFIAIKNDITERKEAQARLEASLHEKSVLLREIHHRVKNNMQIIVSLMSLSAQSHVGASCEAVLPDIARRIQSMAIIHDQFYESEDVARIDLSRYLDSLIADIQARYAGMPGFPAIERDFGEVLLNLETAIPAGLLVSELLENAMKYAYRGRDEPGRVRIEQRSLEGGILEIAVRDEGVGYPEGVDFDHPTTLGLDLIKILAEQLNGEIAFSNTHPGASAVVRFPLPPGLGVSRQVLYPVPRGLDSLHVPAEGPGGESCLGGCSSGNPGG